MFEGELKMCSMCEYITIKTYIYSKTKKSMTHVFSTFDISDKYMC